MTQEEMQDRIDSAYARCFRGDYAESAAIVLLDLIRRFSLERSAFDENPCAMARNVGHRDVYAYLAGKAEVPDAATHSAVAVLNGVESPKTEIYSPLNRSG